MRGWKDHSGRQQSFQKTASKTVTCLRESVRQDLNGYPLDLATERLLMSSASVVLLQ